jgi:acetyl-CoA carboxylase, biotin carboxylase subunit
MIAKLAVWGHDRAEAIARMSRALREFTIAGELTTNLEFHRWIMKHPKFIAGDFDTSFIGQEYHPEAMANGPDATSVAAILTAALALRRDGSNTATQSASGRSTGSPWKTLGRLDVLRR